MSSGGFMMRREMRRINSSKGRLSWIVEGGDELGERFVSTDFFIAFFLHVAYPQYLFFPLESFSCFGCSLPFSVPISSISDVPHGGSGRSTN